MKGRFCFAVGVLAVGAMLAGCGDHYASPAETDAVNKLKTITNDAELCQALGAVNESGNTPGGIATMQREQFNVYAARQAYLTDAIKAKVNAGTFTLSPSQCNAEKRKGAEMYTREKYSREHPKKSEWDKVLGE